MMTNAHKVHEIAIATNEQKFSNTLTKINDAVTEIAKKGGFKLVERYGDVGINNFTDAERVAQILTENYHYQVDLYPEGEAPFSFVISW